ncbi:hypothetical protein NE463_20680, partial [Anaerotruncus colihominis]|nr:hypothetical protein [Anaerotruncus colihominis]
AFVLRPGQSRPSILEQTRAYTPAWAEKVTGVPAEKIVLAARVYAQAKSACLIRGLALDQMHDSVQVCRASSSGAAGRLSYAVRRSRSHLRTA